MSNEIKVDILVAGGGSAGFGAAYRACLHGDGKYTVAIIDANPILGGTSTAGGVNCWEMGIGGPGVHSEIAKSLLKMNNSAAILKGSWKLLVKNRPYAIARPNNQYNYGNTLFAAGVFDRINNHNSFIFEPEAMAAHMIDILNKSGKSKFEFFGGERILGVETTGADDSRSVSKVITDKRVFIPRIVIDCTGDIIVSRKAGCITEMGDKNTGKGINGVTQVYRVERKPDLGIDGIPGEYKKPYYDEEFEERLDNVRVISSINEYPCGDLNINQLPTIDGENFFKENSGEMRNKCLGRVYLHWKRMQEDVEIMRNYKIKEVFRMIGIRESHRLKGEYILTETDVMKGFLKQKNSEDIIAFSDHPADMHGKDSKGITILEKPYGIPYKCLIPKETENLITACRGSSFNRTAAASCRLSRTMIAIGEAAGIAALDCLDRNKTVFEADVGNVRNKLGIPEFTDYLAEKFSDK